MVSLVTSQSSDRYYSEQNTINILAIMSPVRSL